MRREFEAVQAMLINGRVQVRLTQTWQKIHQEQGVGTVVSKMLRLTKIERERLRSWILAQTGVDPYSRDSLPDSRLEAAGKGKNEKLARRNVFADMLSVARWGNLPIRTRNGDARVPPQSVLTITADQLMLQGEVVVTVENGALVRTWHKLAVPPELADALIIYRGHESDAGELRALLKQEMTALNVGFYDFDPAGLLMGARGGHDALLLPRCLDRLSKGGGGFDAMNQPDTFWNQGDQLCTLQSVPCGALAPYVAHVARHRVAVMQEHPVVHGCELELIRLDT